MSIPLFSELSRLYQTSREKTNVMRMELRLRDPIDGAAASISHIVAGIVTVIILIRWQKNRTLDVPVLEAQTPNAVG